MKTRIPAVVSCVAVLGCCTLGVFVCDSALAGPSLSHCVPWAVAPGKTIQVTLHGKELGLPGSHTTLWTSFPAKVQQVTDSDKKDEKNDKKDEKKPQQRGSITYRLTLDEKVSVGVGAVRIATVGGASKPLLVMIDDLPSDIDKGNNHSPASAQMIGLPRAIDGVSDAASADYYKFTAKAAQQVSVEVVAQRLGSDFDPLVRLLNHDGQELLIVDDDVSLGTDCRFVWTAKFDGQYLLEIRDNQFRGGQRYRLRVGDFPLVTVPYPLGVTLGSTAKLGFAGPAAAGVVPVSLTIPDHVPGRLLSMSAKLPGGKSSAMATVVTGSLSEVMEVELNDQPQAATKIALPCAVNGRFEKVRDRDHYQFDAKKGQKLALTSYSRSLGSPSFLFMRLAKSDGSQLASTGGGNSEEVTLHHTLPEDGTYQLIVEDLLGRGGPEFAYRVQIEQVGAGFSLKLKNDTLLTGKGGVIAVEVQCQRSGYDGPVTLSAEGPDGTAYQVHNQVIASKGKGTKLLITLGEDLQQGDLRALLIKGRATINDREYSVVAGTLDLLRKHWPRIMYPPPSLDGLVSVGIVPEIGSLFSLAHELGPIYFPRLVDEATFTFQIKRLHKDFKTALIVKLDGLPAGLVSKIERKDKDKQETYQVTLSGKDVAEGKAKLRIIGFGELGIRVRREIVADVPLEIFTPLSVSVQPAGVITAGGKQKVKIALARRLPGADGKREPVTIRWKKLPTGIAAPGNFTISADVDRLEIDVDLTAASDAKVGKFSDLIVQATTKYQGKEIVVDSQPATLQINKP